METVKNFIKAYKYWILAVLIVAGIIIHAATDSRTREQISSLNQTEEEYKKELEAYMLEYSLPIEEEKAQAEWQAYRLEQRRLEEEREKNFWGEPLETGTNIGTDIGVEVVAPTTEQPTPAPQMPEDTPQNTGAAE